MTHPIICFEGPSSIGKTTLCQSLEEDFNIVPEVNLLFERPSNASKYWYHERQVERYEMCRSADKISILDGDIFQPIWYNWVCNYPSNFLSKDETHGFYRAMLEEGEISFPDLYIIFHVDEDELWKRKEGDNTRRRRNFEKHLKIIEPLKDYWHFLDSETDLEMRLIHYDNFEDTKESVLDCISEVGIREMTGMKVIDQIEGWIDKKSKAR